MPIKPLTGNAGDFSGIVLKAAARGDAEAVRHYLSINPAWLNREGPHGRTLLWEAAYKRRNALVRELLELGADPSPIACYYTPMLVDLSALAVARQQGNDELFEILEAAGASDDLYAACHRGDLRAIEAFLREDADAVHRPARDLPPHPRAGTHPVHYAVAGGQVGALRMLLGSGASIDDHLPLLLDWASGNGKMTRLLKEHSGRNARRAATAAKRGGVPAIDRPDWMGFPPLVDACRGNHNAPDEPARVRALLDRGANVNVRDHKLKTPLHRAAQAGFTRISRLLLDRGAELEEADETGGTPLFDAAKHGRTEALCLLIEHGARVSHADSRGETALFVAARAGRVDTVEALLEAGADPTLRNHRGKTVAEVLESLRQQSPERQRLRKLLAAP